MHDPHRRVDPILWRDPHNVPDIPTGLPGDEPLHSELRLWLYIGKGIGLLMLGALILVNLSYGAFELLSLLE
jgi:hypothetical protein